MIFFSSLNDYGLDLNQIKNIRILTCFDFIFWLIDLYTSTIFILKKKLLGGLLGLLYLEACVISENRMKSPDSPRLYLILGFN